MHDDSLLERLARKLPTPDRTPPEDVAHPPYAFMALGALAAAVLVVTVIGATLANGAQFGFDRAILLALRTPDDLAVPAGPGWLRQVMVDVTALGGRTVLTIAVLLAVGFLLAIRRPLTAALVAAGTGSGSMAVQIGKRLVGRERPVVVDHLVEVGSASFPSAHAANSAIIYLTLALTIMQIIPRPAVRWYLFGATLGLVLLIGTSRVYLGVHWPTDVLAGWAAGALWALAWWAFGSWLRLRRTIPDDHDPCQV